MSDTPMDPSSAKLPEYDDPEATRPHDALAPMSAPLSTPAVVPRSEARMDPLVEVWAWLADEFADRGTADPAGLLQLSEVLALSGHRDAARDTARSAFERAPTRVAVARQFRALAPAAERASSAYAEALSAESGPARLHAFVHAWLAAHLSGSPRPLPIANVPVASWLGACASGVADPDALADVVLAADYVAQLQTDSWAVTYPAAAAVATGLPREPQKMDAAFERLLAACESSHELKPALPWLRRWAKLPIADATSANDTASPDEPVLAALLALQGGGEEALAQWLRAQDFGTSNVHAQTQADNDASLTHRADAERLLAQVFESEMPGVALRVEALISPTDERIAQLAASADLPLAERAQLESLLEQRRMLALPDEARRSLVAEALARIYEAPEIAPLRPPLDAFQGPSDDATERRNQLLATLGSWVAADPSALQEQANLLVTHHPSHPAAVYVAGLFSDESSLPADETTRRLYLSLLAKQGAPPAGFEPTASEALAAEWVTRERAGNGTDAQRRDWAERAQKLCADSPWVQRYTEELARMDGNDLYALLAPTDETAAAESRGDIQEALRLTLARVPAAQTTEQQSALYTSLARLYDAAGDTEKARLCRLEVTTRKATREQNSS